MATGETVVHSLADLGRFFPDMQLPTTQQSDSPADSARPLPLIQRLSAAQRRLRSNHHDKDHDQLVREVLEADIEELKRDRIKVVAAAPLDREGRIATNEVLSYMVFAIFPGISRLVFLTSSRTALAGIRIETRSQLTPEALQNIDDLVRATGGLLPERLPDRYSRLLREVKNTDSLIKHLKEVADEDRRLAAWSDQLKDRRRIPEIDRLNEIKANRIREFLRTADLLIRRFPRLSPLYETNEVDHWHVRLVMYHLKLDGFTVQRLLNPQQPYVVQRSNYISSTNINRVEARAAMQRVNQGSKDNYDLDFNEVASLLGL